MGETPGAPTVSMKLQRVAQQAQRYPAMHINWIVDADVSGFFRILHNIYSIQEKDRLINALKQPEPIRSEGCRVRGLLLVPG
jgi:hypothetical protein